MFSVCGCRQADVDPSEMNEEEISAFPSAPSAESNKPSALEDERLRLEIEKLKDELLALRLPWWKRPIYIAAVFPTFLALVGATAAFLTGYVQTQYQLVQYQKEQVKTDLEKYNTEKNELEIKKQALSGEQARYEKEKQKLVGENAELKKQQQIATPIAYLNTIEAHAEHLFDVHQAENDLIELIKNDKDGKIVSEVERRMSHASQPELHVHMLTVLYLGTGNKQWMNQIWALTRKSADVATREYWVVFGIFFDWPEKDSILSIELLTELLKAHPKLRSETEIFEAIAARVPYAWEKEWEKSASLRTRFSNNDIFFDAVKISRDLALDTQAPWNHRSAAMDILEKLAPHVCVVAGSQIIDHGETSVQVLGFVDRALHSDTSRVRYIATTLNYPNSLDRDKWRNWRNLKQSLVDEASEGNLDTWRTKPPKYDSLFATEAGATTPST